MPTTVEKVQSFLDQFAPPSLAEEWDNVGLLLGNQKNPVERIMTCLTLTPDVAQEAIDIGADMIVSHHPILFRAVKRITSFNPEGQMILSLVENRIAVFSPHTRYDSADAGINSQLASSLGIQNTQPLRAKEEEPGVGSGRYGALQTSLSLDDFIAHVKQSLGVQQLQFARGAHATIGNVAVACGSTAEYLRDAAAVGCQAFVTGESRFHGCLEARSRGVHMILLGHYASERPAMENMANLLSEKFGDIEVTASAVESDPVEWA